MPIMDNLDKKIATRLIPIRPSEEFDRLLIAKINNSNLNHSITRRDSIIDVNSFYTAQLQKVQTKVIRLGWIYSVISLSIIIGTLRFAPQFLIAIGYALRNGVADLNPSLIGVIALICTLINLDKMRI